MDYFQKYLKYKAKYLEIKNQEGGLGGRVYAYFLTENDLKNFADAHTFAVIGSKIKTSLLKSYPYIERKDDTLYKGKDKYKLVEAEVKQKNTGLDEKRKSTLQKIGENLAKSNKFSFEYANIDKVKKVLNHTSMNNSYKYLVIVRHYTVLKDVYCGTFKINNDSIEIIQIKYTRENGITKPTYPNAPFLNTDKDAESQEAASA